MKKKVLMLFIILGMGMLALLLGKREKAMNLSDEQMKDVYIEVLAEDEMSVEKVSIEENDATVIKEMLLEEEIYSDRGFVFAEGGYRIVIDTGEEVIHFYPYCGVGSTIRVGDGGVDFIWLDDKDAEKLNQIVDTYKGGREGIWDWSNVII